MPVKIFNAPPFFKSSLLIILMIALGCIGYTGFKMQGYVDRFQKSDFNKWVEIQMSEIDVHYGQVKSFIDECDFIDRMPKSGNFTEQSSPKIKPICYEADIRKNHRVVLWGDSFAQMLTYGLIKNLPSSWQLLQLSSRGCQPSIFSLSPSTKDYCQQSNFFALSTIEKLRPDVVVISQNTTMNQQNINLFSEKLHGLGVRRVVYVDKPPKWIGELPKLIVRRKIDLHGDRNISLLESEVMNQVSQKNNLTFPNQDRYVNTAEHFCNENGCLIKVGHSLEMSITTLDGKHLTPSASDFFARSILVRLITEP